MNLPHMSDSCIRCGHGLIPDPIRHHWKHCPQCCPEEAAAAMLLTHLYSSYAYAREAAAMRGRPATPR
jgi:hypothetical protein